MRKIRFRAWNGSYMIDPVWTWDQEKCIFEVDNKFHEWWMFGLGNEKIILMQSTGLFDKNGVGIYEGDIVIKYWHTSEDDPAYGIYEPIYIIECDASNGGYNLRSESMEYEEIDSNIILDVIGNRYENPDLLK